MLKLAFILTILVPDSVTFTINALVAFTNLFYLIIIFNSLGNRGAL